MSSNNQDADLPNLETLRDTIKDAQSMLNSVEQLAQLQLLPDDEALLGTCVTLNGVCSEIKTLIGGCSAGGQSSPIMLILGQPKSGKTSLINELIGKRILKQSQHTEHVHKLTRLCYSTTASNRSISEASPSVVDLGLSVELLKRSGLDIVDSPGIQDSPPIDCLMQGSSPALIVYLIDARSGFTREVAEDVSQLRFRYPSSQLVFVLNKMDASTEVSEAAGVSRSEAHSAIVDRTISGLEQLGVEVALSPSKLSASSCQLFCVSCRRLGAIRRGLRSNEIGDVDEETKMWQMSLGNLRSYAVCCIKHRLNALVVEVLEQLDSAGKRLTQVLAPTEEMKRTKEQHWRQISDLQKNSVRDIQTSLSSTMAFRMACFLKLEKREIVGKVVKMFESCESPTEKAIQGQVFAEQMNVCRHFAKIELTERLQRMHEMWLILAEYQKPLNAPSTQPDFDPDDEIQRSFSLQESEKTQPAGKRVSRPPPVNKADRLIWIAGIVKKAARSKNLRATVGQLAEKLCSIMRDVQCSTLTTIARANLRVNEFLEQLTSRHRRLSNHRVECQKLWLRLCSTLTESHIRAIQWNHPLCIGVGAQSSVVYKVTEADGSREMLVKKIAVDDEQFSEMAAGLKYCCDPSNDSILPIRAIIIKKLSNEPIVWKLHLWSDLMKQRSLQHQISQLHEQNSAPKLRRAAIIGLRIAETVAQMHKDGQQHGNLSLSNVFVVEDGTSVQLSDVGQARTRKYLSPDNCSTVETRNHLSLLTTSGVSDVVKVIDACSADVYSVGAIMNALWFGHSGRCDLAKEIARLVGDCRHHQPSNRPSASVLVEKLKKALNEKLCCD